MNIALCGMMGCGKSTVAKIVSKKYGLPLIDTDKLIVEKYGTIADIFACKGEEYFRKIEAETIAEYCAKDSNAVIALGGGAVLREENVVNLKHNGKIVYMRTQESNLAKRLENTADRPLLNGTMRDIIGELLSKRTIVYESVADKIIDTDELKPEQIADAIVETML